MNLSQWPRSMNLFISAYLILSTGCASIVSKSYYPVMINSNPVGTMVSIKDKYGMEIQKAMVPSTVMLPASTGYFSPARYDFKFEKEGYYPSTMSMRAGLDGWYFGNILFGVFGLIGWFIVDPATGAMWELDGAVYGNLLPNPSFKATPPPVASVAEPSVRQPGIASPAEQLKQLKELKESGILTDQEYETRRKAMVEKL